ncbi:TonB-dependent receptor [Bacteroides pyogenes]|uniref:TonB-dependent receptor n=2 Tax=Bacteroides pyogenes TaxID=310300 RepID=UPI001BA9B675|nr:TonB-dependent receptor [Bacteroides pyogenes]MBR8704344.1 Vitamin B12 transporter BtuB [Bacteroides pyogenes]
MKRFVLATLMAFLAMSFLRAEDADKKVKTDANIIGHVIEVSTGDHVPGVSIFLKGTTIGTVSDNTGHFRLMDLPLGKKTVVMKAVGYKTKEQEVVLKKGVTIELNFNLEEDVAALDAVVVSANRNETTRRLAPTLVNVIDTKMFACANANNLAQGIVFQPGVRVENNCQNCGFNQVRINGMDGRYTQILIDSRPIMSALAGVYGLEQIPTNMIERVEVVRGGGSALFGSSAIAGVLNIITKEPAKNSFTVNESLGFTGMKTIDNNLSFNGSIISDDQRAGAMFFGQMRYRNPWDKNDDGFSEIGKIDSRSVGMHAFLRTSDYSRLTAEVHSIQEFRRGGDHVKDEWPAHVAAVAEQIDHSIYSGNLKYDLRSADSKHHFQAYASAQLINRKSYYGGIGELEADGKRLGILGSPVPHDMYGDNYGFTKGRTYMGGAQYSYNFDKLLFMPAQLLLGAEYTRDKLSDNMPIRSWYPAVDADGKPIKDGNKLIPLYPELDQRINNWSQFAQLEWKNNRWSVLLGVRVDEHSEVDDAIVSPRATLRFNPIEDINLRATYAKGFRAPQVFDEDLHVGVVGGEAQKVENRKGLNPEISHAFSLSADMYHRFGEVQANLLVEGFYTRLKDVFTLQEQGAKGDGIKRYTRVNGSGAKIFGANIEGKLAFRRVQLQAGITLTSNKYDDAQEWGERTALTDGTEPKADGSNFKKIADGEDRGKFENEAQADRAITRTPDTYGYFTFGWNPVRPLNIALTGTFTGKMKTPHAIEWGVGAAETDIAAIKAGKRTAGFNDGTGDDAAAPRWDELVTTPSFFDLGAKVSYDFRVTQATALQLYAGMSNIFNSFQKDFDRGASRDSGYIYGPTQPRSFYVGCRYSF